MKRTTIFLICSCIFSLMFFLSSFAEDHFETIYVKAPVSIGNIGIQNLVIGISYQPLSSDNKFLQSPDLKAFINTISVELQGVATQEILSHPYIALDELAALTQSIQAKITALINARIAETYPDRPLSIPASIASVEFYSTERSTLSIKQDAY